jgi:hypothetical protein
MVTRAFVESEILVLTNKKVSLVRANKVNMDPNPFGHITFFSPCRRFPRDAPPVFFLVSGQKQNLTEQSASKPYSF